MSYNLDNMVRVLLWNLYNFTYFWQICKLNLISSEFIWKSSFWKVQKRRYYSFSPSVTYDRSVVSPRRFGVLHQKNWQSQYNWNIVESDIKHNSLNPSKYMFLNNLINHWFLWHETEYKNGQVFRQHMDIENYYNRHPQWT